MKYVAVLGWLTAAAAVFLVYLLVRGPGSYGNCVRVDLGDLDTPENRMVVYAAVPNACFSFGWDPELEAGDAEMGVGWRRAE